MASATGGEVERVGGVLVGGGGGDDEDDGESGVGDVGDDVVVVIGLVGGERGRNVFVVVVLLVGFVVEAIAVFSGVYSSMFGVDLGCSLGGWMGWDEV